MTRVDNCREHVSGESLRVPWEPATDFAIGQKAGESGSMAFHRDSQPTKENMLYRHRPTVAVKLHRLLVLLLLLPIAGFSGLAENESMQVEAKVVIEKALPAVVTLKVLDRKGTEVGQGTGFLISADGKLVTARHVSEAGPELLAITSEGTQHRVTGFLGDDRDYDVAILKIDGDHYPCLPFANTLHSNQWVGLATHLQKAGLAYPTGSVVRVLDFGGVLKHLVTSVPVQPGQSGSPMLNESGQVIGVLFGSRSDSHGSIAPVEVVMEILAQRGSTNPVPASKRPRRGSLPVVKDAEFRAGCEAMHRKDWTEAIRRFLSLARRYPESPTTHLLLGISYRETASWAYAKGAFAKAIEHKPQSSIAWFLYGSTLVTLERFADGADALQQSLEMGLNETNQVISAWAHLATAYAGLGDATRAQQAIDNLRKLDVKKADEARARIGKKHPNLPLSTGGNQK